MRTLKIKALIIGERQRKKIEQKDLQELKKGILTKGLMHPPVVSQQADGFHLVAGERRTRAMAELHEEGHTFTFEGEPVPFDEMPYTLIGELTPVDLLEAELEENILRTPLHWMEEVQARNAIHQLRLDSNPDQTVIETAKEVAEKSNLSFERERKKIANAVIIAKHLNNPKVQNARNEAEAIKIVLDDAENRMKAELKKKALLPVSRHQLILGDCLDELRKLPPNSVDSIITDPPYGMKADKMGKGEFHMYDDSPETARKICEFIISEGFRISKPKAILFMFCDVDHFVHLRDHASRMAWSCWRQPLIWRKGSEGHAPWGRAGFVRTYECILFAVKGQKELIFPGGPDILDYKRPARSERVHSAEKPVDLLAHLIRISTLPHQTVLDPCMGSGPMVEAANKSKVKLIGIEKDQATYDLAVARLSEEIEDDREPAGSSNLLD